MSRNGFALLLFIWAFLACSPDKPDAKKLILQSIAYSGSDSIEGKQISFVFRDKRYSSIHKVGSFSLNRTSLDHGDTILDVLDNSGFKRFINDTLMVLPDSLASRYSNSVNSVHYFAYLPYGLEDKAVQPTYLGEVKVQGTVYEKIKVTFTQEGGGDDFEDVFVYWFQKDSLTVDYLAYKFHINGGGLRFRKAFNIRRVGGIRFVDYYNYVPSIDFKGEVEDLDQAFDQNQLELLSNICIENIEVTSCKDC